MLKFILISIIVLYLLSKAMKYFMRWAFLFAGRKMQQKFEEAQKQANSPYTQHGNSQSVGSQGGHFAGERYKAGNVEVEVPLQQKPKRGPFRGGDYVDFEEVE